MSESATRKRPSACSSRHSADRGRTVSSDPAFCLQPSTQTNPCGSGIGSIEVSSSEVFRGTIQTTGDDFKGRDDFESSIKRRSSPGRRNEPPASVSSAPPTALAQTMNCFMTSLPLHRRRRRRSSAGDSAGAGRRSRPVRHLLRHRAGRSRPMRSRSRCLAPPFTSTEEVVTLFAYACNTLSRPEGIIDIRSTIVPATWNGGTMSRLNAPRPEQSPARPNGRILRRPPAH
jgi:hypothetical protein